MLLSSIIEVIRSFTFTDFGKSNCRLLATHVNLSVNHKNYFDSYVMVQHSGDGDDACNQGVMIHSGMHVRCASPIRSGQFIVAHLVFNLMMRTVSQIYLNLYHF